MPPKKRATYRTKALGTSRPIPRLRLDLSLTAGEVRKLKTLAAEDMRPIGAYIAALVIKHLALKRRSLPKAVLSSRRIAFDVATRIPKRELAELRRLADEQERSLSVYVTLLVLEQIGRA